MSNHHYCQACTNEKFGIRTRVYVAHTCGKNTQGNDEHATCPECNKEAGAHELKMFGGLCEDCADGLNNNE
jgi:hypothetical protein